MSTIVVVVLTLIDRALALVQLINVAFPSMAGTVGLNQYKLTIEMF